MGKAPNRIILGLMNFGPDKSLFNVRVSDLDEFKAILDTFQAKGYDEVDTARAYASGQQEAFSVKAGIKERDVKIATKWYPTPQGQPVQNMIDQLDLGLKALESDTVDIFYLHAPDRSTPFTDTLKAVNEAHKAGKFKELGLSNFTAAEVAEIATICKYEGYVRPTIYQGAYNLINRTPERDLVPTLRRFGIEWVVYSPIAGGLLTDKFKGKSVDYIPEEGRFSNAIGRIGPVLRGRYFKETTFKILQDVDAVAEKHGISRGEYACRWLVHHSALDLPSRGNGGKDGIIIGASSLAQLKDYLSWLEKGPLPEDLLDAIETAWVTLAPEPPVYWHGDYKYTYDTVKNIWG